VIDLKYKAKNTDGQSPISRTLDLKENSIACFKQTYPKAIWIDVFNNLDSIFDRL